MLRPSFPLAALLVAGSALFVVGCSHDAQSSEPDAGSYSVPVPVPATPAPGIPCSDGGPGCPCTVAGATEACRAEELHVGSYIACAGTRICRPDTGTWSTCAPSLNLQQPDGGIAPAAPGAH